MIASPLFAFGCSHSVIRQAHALTGHMQVQAHVHQWRAILTAGKAQTPSRKPQSQVVTKTHRMTFARHSSRLPARPTKLLNRME